MALGYRAGGLALTIFCVLLLRWMWSPVSIGDPSDSACPIIPRPAAPSPSFGIQASIPWDLWRRSMYKSHGSSGPEGLTVTHRCPAASKWDSVVSYQGRDVLFSDTTSRSMLSSHTLYNGYFDVLDCHGNKLYTVVPKSTISVVRTISGMLQSTTVATIHEPLNDAVVGSVVGTLHGFLNISFIDAQNNTVAQSYYKRDGLRVHYEIEVVDPESPLSDPAFLSLYTAVTRWDIEKKDGCNSLVWWVYWPFVGTLALLALAGISMCLTGPTKSKEGEDKKEGQQSPVPEPTPQTTDTKLEKTE
ncbi:hypothetical protein Pelo_5913 [Pelomyxa schiedti]|nr:hypothetical protein Pelo_5913 [Pelomyxa schiedti]